jgi:hypothetical protein
MRNLINSATGTVMCAMMAVSVAPTQAAAGVVGIGDQAKLRTTSPVEQVYYRYYGHRHYYHHYRHYSYWRHHYYRHYGYYPYYNPVGAAVGTAVGTAAAVATFPFWGWGYPYY